MFKNDFLSFQKAFTLAEVLITLGIIGIVAAMTLPTLIQKQQQKILFSQFKKVYSNNQNIINQISADFGGNFECYNIKNGEYHCNDCFQFWENFFTKIKFIKKCPANDYTCRPKYKTKSEVLAEGGTIKNTSCGMDVNTVYDGYITSDGTIYYIDKHYYATGAYSNFFAVDINGIKGPNKWGYDLFYMNLHKKNEKSSVINFDSICSMQEKGGFEFNEILLK